MARVLEKAEQRTILRDVSWETYQSLLREYEDRSSPRLTYDRGVLEIMSPSAEHEEYNRTIALLVEIVAAELDIDIRNLGSTTFKLKEQLRGAEPDSCFYVQHAGEIAGKASLDLTIDPPPDLVIEIDITRDSIDKLPIYGSMGVPEIWRFDGTVVTIYLWAGESYSEAEQSRAVPLITRAVVESFVAKSKAFPRTAWLKALRQWCADRELTES